jgi:hypothetical protein
VGAGDTHPVAHEREIRHVGEEARRHPGDPGPADRRFATIDDDPAIRRIECRDRLRITGVPRRSVVFGQTSRVIQTQHHRPRSFGTEEK